MRSPKGAREVQRQRALEGAILALLIERLPRATDLDQLRQQVGETAAEGEIGAAVESLVEVGLLRRDGSGLLPTPAASRAAEIELGLV
jgi:hypothetical protein